MSNGIEQHIYNLTNYKMIVVRKTLNIIRYTKQKTPTRRAQNRHNRNALRRDDGNEFILAYAPARIAVQLDKLSVEYREDSNRAREKGRQQRHGNEQRVYIH